MCVRYLKALGWSESTIGREASNIAGACKCLTLPSAATWYLGALGESYTLFDEIDFSIPIRISVLLVESAIEAA